MAQADAPRSLPRLESHFRTGIRCVHYAFVVLGGCVSSSVAAAKRNRSKGRKPWGEHHQSRWIRRKMTMIRSCSQLPFVCTPDFHLPTCRDDSSVEVVGSSDVSSSLMSGEEGYPIPAACRPGGEDTPRRRIPQQGCGKKPAPGFKSPDECRDALRSWGGMGAPELGAMRMVGLRLRTSSQHDCLLLHLPKSRVALFTPYKPCTTQLVARKALSHRHSLSGTPAASLRL